MIPSVMNLHRRNVVSIVATSFLLCTLTQYNLICCNIAFCCMVYEDSKQVWKQSAHVGLKIELHRLSLEGLWSYIGSASIAFTNVWLFKVGRDVFN